MDFRGFILQNPPYQNFDSATRYWTNQMPRKPTGTDMELLP